MPKASDSLSSIFFTFLKIGAFTIGGGYAMLPLIRREVVETKGWLSEETFLDGLAAAQSSPGPIAINISIYVGLQVRGKLGMAAAVLGTVLPSLITIMVIAELFAHYADNPWVRKAFRGLKPAVVVLIAVPLVQMVKNAKLNWTNFWVPIVSMALVAFLGFSPIWLILAAIVFSVVQGLWKARRDK
ncbi:MAG: chromate transporter [Candidatus Cloacimonetes bacterium]|nr:chromate transporter [Candidatus Cloacimonadota bacterium]